MARHLLLAIFRACQRRLPPQCTSAASVSGHRFGSIIDTTAGEAAEGEAAAAPELLRCVIVNRSHVCITGAGVREDAASSGRCSAPSTAAWI
uniref:Secreted protein n=1 Tax=Engystomops pustulosus TaxID=76066 RepID=A0AAV6Z009_ENGPU|nr:hypothetical protein GDO81_026599 [Engystomops pustulosus]